MHSARRCYASPWRLTCGERRPDQHPRKYEDHCLKLATPKKIRAPSLHCTSCRASSQMPRRDLIYVVYHVPTEKPVRDAVHRLIREVPSEIGPIPTTRSCTNNTPQARSRNRRWNSKNRLRKRFARSDPPEAHQNIGSAVLTLGHHHRAPSAGENR